MNNIFKFRCGCEFECERDSSGNIVSLNYEPENVPLDCSATWDIMCEGKTCGVFQFDKHSGRKWAKAVGPRNIPEFAAAAAIMRPGTTQSFEEDGKSIAHHFCDRKHGKEKVKYPHPSVEQLLEEGQGYQVMQEQSMLIVQKVAGFSLNDAYGLLKGIGKKKIEVIDKYKKQFFEGCKNKNIITDDAASLIWEQISASARYQFNLSHAVAYSLDAYLFSAYPKAHFSRAFYCPLIDGAKDHKELATFISGLLEDGLFIRRPDLALKNKETGIIEKDLVLGLSSVKSVGDSIIDVLIENLPPNITKCSWEQIMYSALSKIKKNAAEALIKCGALSRFLDEERQCMAYELEVFNSLNKKQQDYIRENLADSNLKDALEFVLEQPTGKGYPCYNSRSVTKLQRQYTQFVENYPEGEDTNRLIAKWERDYLGREFTCTELDSCELPPDRITCQHIQLKQFVPKHTVNLPIKITYLNLCNQKDGKEMCWVKGYDSTSNIDNIAVFGDVFAQYGHLLYEHNLVNLVGKPSDSIFIVEEVHQL